VARRVIAHLGKTDSHGEGSTSTIKFSMQSHIFVLYPGPAGDYGHEKTGNCGHHVKGDGEGKTKYKLVARQKKTIYMKRTVLISDVLRVALPRSRPGRYALLTDETHRPSDLETSKCR
jgi:hypothetical protein